jgi:hypothetical protein
MPSVWACTEAALAEGVTSAESVTFFVAFPEPRLNLSNHPDSVCLLPTGGLSGNLPNPSISISPLALVGDAGREGETRLSIDVDSWTDVSLAALPLCFEPGKARNLPRVRLRFPKSCLTGVTRPFVGDGTRDEPESLDLLAF